MGRWSSWILAANGRRMASSCCENMLPYGNPWIGILPLFQLNTVETHLQPNFMRLVPGLHHLTTRYKLIFWALIYNLIKRSKLAIISLLTTKASVCILSIDLKNTTKGRKEGCCRAAKTFRSWSPSNLERSPMAETADDSRANKGGLQGFL